MRAASQKFDPKRGLELAKEEDAEGAPARLVVPVRALVVARKDARLKKLTSALAECGIASYVVEPEGSRLFDAMDRDPRVSVVVAKVGDLGDVHRQALKKILFDQPSTHVVAIGATGTIKQTLSKFSNCLLFRGGDDPAAIAAGVIQRLNEHFFDPQIVETMATVLNTVVKDADIELKALPPLLRVGATVLGELSAMTIVGGHDVNGRVTVSAPSVFYERLSTAWLGRPPANREDIWDCAGELCNRLTGVVRSHYLERGLDSRQSIATIIEGSGVSIRCMTTKPGLVVPCELERLADPIYVELVLANKADDRAPVAEDELPMNTGELTFL